MYNCLREVRLSLIDDANDNSLLYVQSAKKSKKDKDFETPKKADAEEEKKVRYILIKNANQSSAVEVVSNFVFICIIPVIKEIIKEVIEKIVKERQEEEGIINQQKPFITCSFKLRKMHLNLTNSI